MGKKNLKVMFLCVLSLAGFSTVAFSRTYKVSQIQTEGAVSTVTAALKLARPGDLVLIEEGVYRERLILRDGVTIRGAGAGLTRIEYSGKGSVVYGKNVKDAAIENVSLTCRGREKKSIVFLVSSKVSIFQVVLYGGSLSGIEARGDSMVDITETVVKGNRGSGIFLYKGAKGYIGNSQIVGNRYFGIEVKSGALLSSRNNLISENQAGGVNLMKESSLELYGTQIFSNENYGVLINEKSSGKIVNNNILGNGRAGILVFSGGVSVIQNNIISYNSTGIKIRGDKLPFISHNNVWNNDVNYENMDKPESDISLDPLFTGNYRLKRGSPMIGRGFWGQDIGAFHFESNAPARPVSKTSPAPVQKIEKVFSEAPGDPCDEAVTYYNKGVARQDFSRVEIDYYKKAISLCGEHYKSHFNLGVVYKKLKMYNEAIVEFKAVLKIKSDFVDAHYNLGEIYDTLNSLDLAIGEYLQAIQLNPDKLNAHYNLGGIYVTLRKNELAKRELEESLRIDPSHAPSLLLLKKVNKELQKREKQ